MFARSVVCVVCIVQTMWLGVPAMANPSSGYRVAGPPSAASMVDRGVQLYMEGHYEKAKELLEKAISMEDLDVNRRLGALLYLASCHIALGDATTARASFRTLLKIRSDYRLPAGTAPKIIKLFEEVRKQVASERPATPVIEHRMPDHGILGASLTLEATVQSLPKGGSLVVLYRYDDHSKYSIKQMKAGQKGVFQVTLPSPMSTQKGQMEYLIDARDSNDRHLAWSTRTIDPHRVPFLPPKDGGQKEEESSTWWIWVLVGGVVAGAAVGLGVGLTQGGESKGRAIVTVDVVD